MSRLDPETNERFLRAFAYARGVHADDRIKGTDLPYLRHLLEVVEIVVELDGDEDQTIAALLHDTLEDHPELVTAEGLAQMFGDRVATFVRACSDTEEKPKPPWCYRKVRYIGSIPHKPRDALLVSLADKIANARAILRDLLTPSVGRGVFDRFNGGHAGTMWYYRGLVEAFRAEGMEVSELERPVDRLESISGVRRDKLICDVHGIASEGGVPNAPPTGKEKCRIA